MVVKLLAAIKVSVESVVESLVSRYESHFTKNRNLLEKNDLDDMNIAETGQCHAVMEAAMKKYWWAWGSASGKWHFISKSEASTILDYKANCGEATIRLMKQKSKYSIKEI